jgi:hypothetical protein
MMFRQVLLPQVTMFRQVLLRQVMMFHLVLLLFHPAWSAWQSL